VAVPKSSGISLAWRFNFLQSLSLHLQFHPRILLEDLASTCRRSCVTHSSATPPALSRVAYQELIHPYLLDCAKGRKKLMMKL
jgi:hypothetical protein